MRLLWCFYREYEPSIATNLCQALDLDTAFRPEYYSIQMALGKTLQ